MQTKICSECKRDLPISSFCKNRKRRDGAQTYCKECSRKRDRQRYPARAKWLNALTKKWAMAHPEKVKESDNKYRTTYPNRIREAQKRYRTSHKEECKARTKRWRASSPKYGEYQIQYRNEHSERICAASAKRRALKRNNGHTPYNFQQIFSRDNGICYLGNKPVDPRCWNLDHIIPISRGGSDTPDNVGVLCPHHNKVKHAKLLSELNMATIGECGK